jgi:hypothetical protein
MIRMIIGLLALLAWAAPASAGEALDAEHAFAHLLFGEYFRDPCAGMTANVKSCPPRFSDKRMDYQDEKAKQAYVFNDSPCIIHATTTIAATGKTYEAIFNLQNVAFVNLGRNWRDGDIAGFEFLMQGDKVIVSDGTAGSVLYILHKYRADPAGKIDHDINAEVLAVRKAVKAYQEKFCPNMG